MRRLAALPLLLCLSLPAVAQTAATPAPLTAEAFDAYSLGKTLYYNAGGTPYGAEEYLPDHKVIWAFIGQECKYGRWYVDAQQHICFAYDGDKDPPQCWSFYAQGTGLAAHYEGLPTSTDLIEVQQTSAPLFCPGPKVGT